MIFAASLLRSIQFLSGRGGILAFHGIGADAPVPAMHLTPAQFADCLDRLPRDARIIPLSEFLSRVRRGRTLRGLVAITFDDAYVGVLRYALPLLEGAAMPATVFATTIGTAEGVPFWWDIAGKLMQQGRTAELSLMRPSRDAHDGDASSFESLRTLILENDAGRWERLATTPNLSLGDEWHPLRLDALQRLAAHPLIDIGVHTTNHPVLPRLPFDEQVREISENFDYLHRQLPGTLRVVAYPYGRQDETTRRAAVAAGMTAGVTIEGWAARHTDDVYRVPRIGIGAQHTATSVELRLTAAARPLLRARAWRPHVT